MAFLLYPKELMYESENTDKRSFAAPKSAMIRHAIARLILTYGMTCGGTIVDVSRA